MHGALVSSRLLETPFTCTCIIQLSISLILSRQPFCELIHGKVLYIWKLTFVPFVIHVLWNTIIAMSTLGKMLFTFIIEFSISLFLLRQPFCEFIHDFSIVHMNISICFICDTCIVKYHHCTEHFRKTALYIYHRIIYFLNRQPLCEFIHGKVLLIWKLTFVLVLWNIIIARSTLGKMLVYIYHRIIYFHDYFTSAIYGKVWLYIWK